jgi:beta-galactosidase
MAIGSTTIEANALHYTPFDLERSLHPYELTYEDDVILRLNYKQMGIGGDDGWGARPLSKYTMFPNQTYQYSYTLKPITANHTDLMSLSKSVASIELIQDIKVDGVSIKDFSSATENYLFSVLRGTTQIPQISAVAAAEGVIIEIDQANSLPGTATIVVTSANGLFTKTYTIEFEVVDYYLSDMDWESATTGWLTVQKDKSIEGNPIRLLTSNGQQTFKKGIGTHANSTIVYNLSGQNFVEFLATIGVDQEVSGTNSNRNTIEFQVFLDGELAYQSGLMRASTIAKNISLDVTGVNELKLVVHDNGDGNAEDHANWADARLVKMQEDIGDDEPSIYLQGPEQAVQGTTFEVQYGVYGQEEQVFGSDLTLEYDPQLLVFSGVEASDNRISIVNTNTEEGIVRLIVAHFEGAPINGEHLKLTFMANGENEHTVVTMKNAILANSIGEETEYASFTYSVQLISSDTVDKQALVELIAQALEVYNTAVEGELPGQYPLGSKQQLMAEIQLAEDVINDDHATQEEVNFAYSSLNAAIISFLESKLPAIPGDTNSDGKLTIGDLSFAAYAYGKNSSDPDWSIYQVVDVIADNLIDINDLAFIARRIIEQGN